MFDARARLDLANKYLHGEYGKPPNVAASQDPGGGLLLSQRGAKIIPKPPALHSNQHNAAGSPSPL